MTFLKGGGLSLKGREKEGSPFDSLNLKKKCAGTSVTDLTTPSSLKVWTPKKNILPRSRFPRKYSS
jgi:hypothetical protein